MHAPRLLSISMACQQSTGGYPPEIVNDKGEFGLSGIQIEVDGQNEPTGRFRQRPKNSEATSRPAGVTHPKGDWPSNWADYTHEFDGHGIDAAAEDRTREDILTQEIYSLYVQHGVEEAYDDVSGACLDPGLVRAGRGVEINFFETMGVYERVPRTEQQQTKGKIIGTKWIDTNRGYFDNPRIRSCLAGKEFCTGPDDALYASTPPLEALRLLISRAATTGQG